MNSLRIRWFEVLVGLAVLALLGYAFPIFVLQKIDMTLAEGGVIAAFLSGAASLAGFAVVAWMKQQPWAFYGIRRVSQRWLWLGAAGGILALAAKLVVTPLFIALTDTATDTQAGYIASSSNTLPLLILTAIGLIVLTPIGEEFLFRGVVTTALLRYHWLMSVVGSAVIFAVMHGINVIFPAALIVGIIAAELRRRSGSVWPGVITHAVNNTITVATYALVPMVV